MYSYGRRSFAVLDELHPSFRPPLMDVIKIVNISLLKGMRPREEQREAFAIGASMVNWPDSAHNLLEENIEELKVYAFDAMPWYADKPGGIDWRTDKELADAIARQDAEEFSEILENIKRIHYTTGIIRGVFRAHGIILINGSDWDGNNKFDDHTFTDSPHYQALYWKKLRHEDWRIYKNG